MIDPTPVAPLSSSPEAYQRHGWRLVPIPAGTKGPNTPGWNRPDADPTIPPGYGMGLAHAYSGTCAIDIDDWDTARAYLAQGGIDLDQLYRAPDAVIVDSGRPGHGKLLYALPIPLPSKKVLVGPRPFLEFRCASHNGMTLQDVLPPSRHPLTGQPYRWSGNGHWTRLPPLPEPLLAVWRALLEADAARTIQTGEPLAASWDEIRGALSHISPDCSRDEWIAIGMALHWAGVQSGQADAALLLWDEWSAGCETKYPGSKEIVTQWRAMRADKLTHVTLGTLYHYARLAGWERPRPDVSGLFAAVAPPASPVDVLREGFSLDPPDMDLALWPLPLRALAIEMADGIGCDPIMPLVAGLGAACAVADARSRLELMPRFRVPPVLWLATIGKPADKKTPGSQPMMEILTELETADHARFRTAMLEWEALEAYYAASKKDFLSAAAQGVGQGVTLPPMPVLPPQPVPLRLRVDDITSQKLVRHAAERPQGFLCHLDEMLSWVRKVCDLRSGEDRSAWTRAYEAQSYVMDRVGAGTIYAPNLAVSIFGNIQPAVLRTYAAPMTADGMLQRFIVFPLRFEHTKRGDPIPDMLSCRPAWNDTIRLIHAMGEQHYKLSYDAYLAFREFQAWYEQYKRDENAIRAPDDYMTAIGKLEGTTGRLILLWHMIESPFVHEVSADTVARVVRLVQSYIVPALRHVLVDMTGAVEDTLVNWCREHIIQYAGEQSVITLQEIRRSARRQVENQTIWQAEGRIADAMAALESARWVMRIEDQPQRHHVAWAIHPSLATTFADYRRDVIDAKQRLLDQIQKRADPKNRRVVKGYSREG